MSHATSGPPGSVATELGGQFRVIPHEPICPECGSFDIVENDIDTGDGLIETALTCRACGTCWPVACVTDWTRIIYADHTETADHHA